jgi:hypothetical protein
MGAKAGPGARDGAWSLLNAALHELAQPAASAGLALDVAATLLERGDAEAARRKLGGAGEHIAQLQRALLVLGTACSRRMAMAPMDLAPLLAGLALAPAQPGPLHVVANEAMLGEALRHIRRWCAEGTAAPVQIRGDPDAVVIVFSGGTPPSPAVRLWLAALRRTGGSVGVRRAGARARITLRLMRAGR